MIRSVFLRRIILIMITALALSAVLASVLFILESGRTLTSAREAELFARSSRIADDYAKDQGTGLADNPMNAVITNLGISGVYVLILDANGDIAAISTAGSNRDEAVLTHMQSALNYNQLPLSDTGNGFLSSAEGIDSGKIMIAQSPIISGNSTLGYVIFAEPMDEIFSVQHELVQILIVTTFLVSLFMLVPIYFATHRLVRPLHKMNEAARAMGQGDFSARADTNAKGEVGELACSFNELADRLSNSISDLTIERNRLREIFDVISEGIVSVDLNLRPVYTNPAIYTLFEKAKRKNYFTENLQLIPFDDVWNDFRKCIDQGITVERTIDIRESAYLSTIVPSFDSNHIVNGATGFFRDISESEHLEQTRRDYVANVSHELRTPLTALRGLVEPLADGMVKNEADRLRYYGIILHETLRLSRLIDDMLELSRLQARTIAFKTFPFDLNSLLEELEAKFTPIMNDAQISFHVDYKDGPCPTVMGNPDRVEQILIILMDNAKKYTPPDGSITIITEMNEKKDTVLVSVRDTGQGIHEYDIDHIFDRFYKADRARGKKGTGLGLSIAKELLNYMGETISVQSDYGEGTTFTFTLKCVQDSIWF